MWKTFKLTWDLLKTRSERLPYLLKEKLEQHSLLLPGNLVIRRCTMVGSHRWGKTCQKVLFSSGVEAEHHPQHTSNKGKECKCLGEEAFVENWWFDGLKGFFLTVWDIAIQGNPPGLSLVTSLSFLAAFAPYVINLLVFWLLTYSCHALLLSYLSFPHLWRPYLGFNLSLVSSTIICYKNSNQNNIFLRTKITFWASVQITQST